MSTQTTKWIGYLLILGSAVCFGSYGVWSRLLGHEFGIFSQGWVRSVLILLLLLPFVRKKHFRPLPKNQRKWFAMTMISTLFTQAPLYFAFNHLSLGTATLIFYGLFLITTYSIGWLFLDEKITQIKLLSLLLSILGLFLIFGFSLTTFSLVPLLLAALNGIASGAEIATSKKVHITSLQIVFYSWILILVTHLPLALLFGEVQVVPSWNLEWLAMLGYAASGMAGFWLVVEGFKYVDASIGGLIGLLEIIFSTLFGVWFFADHLTIEILIGGCIILCAGVIPDLYALKHPKEPPPSPPLPH
ncbi:MAG: DMT family transporter [Rhabdochlamydiaceae bacterium]|jgi:drug/metabolite transporter (DMT)-like permease